MPSYYSPGLTDSDSYILLEGEELHHLSHVKRIGTGEVLKLNNGKGLLATGKILELNKRFAKIEILEIEEQEVLQSKFAIAFALLKNKHDEMIVEKCTELGASDFYPFVSEFSVKTPTDNTTQRLERIALAAIKQCDNPFLPNIHATLKLEKVLERIVSSGWMPVACSERRSDIWLRDLELTAPPCFLIGPEGGWSISEYALFSAGNVAEIALSRLITRAETAAISVAAQYVGSNLKAF